MGTRRRERYGRREAKERRGEIEAQRGAEEGRKVEGRVGGEGERTRGGEGVGKEVLVVVGKRGRRRGR